MTKLVSIVIPAYNNYPLLHQLLMDIKQHCQGVNEVLVVNDASTETDIYKGLEFWKKIGVIPLRTIHVEENQGFLLTANQGMKAAKGDIIILLSTDVRIYNKKFMEDVLHSVNDETFVGAKLYTNDTGWNKFGEEIIIYLEGWCLAATRDVWECLGYFDERYVPNDYEDVDISRKAYVNSKVLVEIDPGSIAHLGGRSIGYSPEREALTIENRKKFATKWNLPL